MKCAECDATVGNQALQLKQNAGGAEAFCSFECLITYSVKQVQQRLRRQQRRVRILVQETMAESPVTPCRVRERRRFHRGF